MKKNIKCPGCGEPLSVDDAALVPGKKINCPKCGDIEITGVDPRKAKAELEKKGNLMLKRNKNINLKFGK